MNSADNPRTIDIIAGIVFIGVAVAALCIVRVSLFYYESFDYIQSLSVWIERYRGMTFWEGLGTRVSNYNQPYMYFLNVFARLSSSGELTDMYLIKSLSVIFDAVLAYFVMKLVSLKYDGCADGQRAAPGMSFNMKILVFLLAFAVPTVIINSSMWGQCDSIYVSFAVAAVYYALRGRSRAAWALIGLSVAFKLQGAFILPLFAVFALQGKIKLRDCWLFFAVFFGTLLPAFIAGYPLDQLLLVYVQQTDTYHYLKLNAVNIWQFIENVDFEHFRTAGLFAGGTAVLGLMYFVYVHRAHLSKTVDYVRLAFLFAVLVPFLLPQMHDRFFYMADIFALTLFLFDKRRWFVPLVCVFCSFISYAWLTMNYVYIFDYKIAALMLTAVIFTVLRDLVISLRGQNA